MTDRVFNVLFLCTGISGQSVIAEAVLPVPASAAGSEAERRLAFSEALRLLSNRISGFVALPIASLDRLSLQSRLDRIGGRGS